MTSKQMAKMFGDTCGYEVDQFDSLSNALVALMRKLEKIEALLVAKKARKP